MSDTERAARVAATTMEELSAGDLLARVDALRAGGWRLVQMMGIDGPGSVELSYSFGLGLEMLVLRFQAPDGQALPSITPVFAGAYLYENEIRDLFGVAIERINVDWMGKVYDVAGTAPFRKVTIAPQSSEGGPR